MRDLQIYKVDVDMSSGILFAKQKPGRTFDFDNQNLIADVRSGS